MTTTQRREQRHGMEDHRREALDALIGEQVLHALGSPSDLLRVQVRLLWENYYRVNVYVGADAASARVAHSYFLLTDGEGNIVAPTPTITKVY